MNKEEPSPNERNVLDISSGRLFPIQFQFLGIICLVMTPVFFVYATWAGPISLLIGSFIVTARVGVTFSGSSGRYRDYYDLLFVKFGKWQPLSTVEKVYLKSSDTRQFIYTRVTVGSNIRKKEYDGYLKFVNGDTVHLRSGQRKEKIKDLVTKVAAYFELEAEDYT